MGDFAGLYMGSNGVFFSSEAYRGFLVSSRMLIRVFVGFVTARYLPSANLGESSSSRCQNSLEPDGNLVGLKSLTSTIFQKKANRTDKKLIVIVMMIAEIPALN